ncbi:MAG: beta-ketoacyl synthase, partial [Desulfobacterales bacterium]|nr:beta-ketoacyl synthase [Desulfobacterales bacterium]
KHIAIGSVKSMTGHLLTAAGAAGFIKTVLAMNKGFLPPSLNYSAPPSKSLLNKSNIKVQTMVEDWSPARPHSTRKAGISAFGFGGINAHLLVEEFRKTSTRHIVKSPEQLLIDKKSRLKKVPCAIIGMETIAKDCLSLSRFKDLVFDKASLSPELPGSRWKKTKSQIFEEKPGFYLDHLSTRPGEFHIPPNQMDDILPQQIILLKAAKGALEDAKISPRPLEGDPQRDRIGCAIGIEFDYGATDFHLRWKINHLDEEQKDTISPPLTFNRTLGALGGIVASRVAREFKLGGPCFTLSAGAVSGIKTIETAVHSLSAWETDVFICGCVDLAGDIRQFALNDIAKPHTEQILPSEGACAIVLKRLDQAREDGDRIYGVITGMAGASSGAVPGETGYDLTRSEALYTRSLENALKNSKTSLKDIDLYEACLSGIKENDETEIKVLNSLGLNDPDKFSCHITSTSSVIGNTRGASALFSVIKTALCLNYRVMPLNKTVQKACVASITLDGACSHVVLEENGQKNQIQQDTLILDPALIAKGGLATSNAHEKFLEFSKENMRILEKQFETLTRLAGSIIQDTEEQPADGIKVPAVKPPFLDREQCLEYAIGKAGHVLGKEFDIIDTYPVRVRLPDEPLMLVDRIMDIQGEMLSLTSGKIITQHDVRQNAWYLDGGKAPVSISIEAGQADLFLCAFLGIDHVVKGTRKYRLLDARVTFHRTLPEPGETIEYHIEIDRF